MSDEARLRMWSLGHWKGPRFSCTVEFQRPDTPPDFSFLAAKSALLIDCYFNETSWYQLREDIFIRYDWVDSHVESIWCKTWTHSVLRYPSKYFLWNRKITKELVIRRWKKKLKSTQKKSSSFRIVILVGVAIFSKWTSISNNNIFFLQDFWEDAIICGLSSE